MSPKMLVLIFFEWTYQHKKSLKSWSLMIIKAIPCNNSEKKNKTFSEPTFKTLLHSGTCSFNNLHLTKVLFLQREGNIKIQLHNINGCNKIPTVFVSTVLSRGEGKSEERKKETHICPPISQITQHIYQCDPCAFQCLQCEDVSCFWVCRSCM